MNESKAIPLYPKVIKSILIILMGSLGDVARGLSLVSVLKEHYKNARITWLVEPKCTDLVRLHPQIDRILVFNRGRGLRALIELRQSLREEKYDLCLDLQRHFKSGLFSKISGSKRILGFNRKDSKEFNWLFSHEKIEAHSKNLPKIEHYWKFLEYLEISAPKSQEVELNLPQFSHVVEKFSLPSQGDFLLLVLGSSWNSKDWPISGYQKLIYELSSAQSSLKFILSGGREHAVMGEILKKNFTDRNIDIYNLCGQSTLAELCIIIRRSKVVVGPDSGPGHLAALLSVPFIGLFGPTDASRTSPYGEKVNIISAKIGCSPCYRRECPGLNKLCMRMINPREVADAVLEAL